jgi:hypothetical protein
MIGVRVLEHTKVDACYAILFGQQPAVASRRPVTFVISSIALTGGVFPLKKNLPAFRGDCAVANFSRPEKRLLFAQKFVY